MLEVVQRCCFGHNGANLVGLERLDLQELFGEETDGVAIVLDDPARPIVARHDHAPDLIVHALRGGFADPVRAIGFEGVPGFAIGERTELRHAPLADHVLGDVGGALDVVRSAARHVVHEDLFRHPSAHQHRDLGFEEALGVGVAVGFRQLHRHAHRPAARDDRDLVQRVGVGQERGDDRVASLVVSAVDAIHVAQRDRPPLHAHEDLVARGVQVAVGHRASSGAPGEERRLVDQIGEVGPGEPRRAAGDDAQVGARIDRNLAGVDAENGLASLEIRVADRDLTVEPSRPQQRRIEDVRTVGGGNHHDAAVRLEAVHLDQQLVERLLALFVAERAAAAAAADRVELVDEHDARGMAAGIAEEAADARRAHARVHLDEVRPAGKEERHAGFAGNRSRQECLARPRGADEQNALRDPAADG